MKVLAVIVALTAAAQAHVVVPPGSFYPVGATRPVLLLPPYYSHTPHVKPVTVVLVAPRAPDTPKVEKPLPEEASGKTPDRERPSEEPAVAAKPAFPAAGDEEDLPTQFPDTEPEEPNGDEGEKGEGELDIDEPLEQPGFQDGDNDDDLGVRTGNEDAPAVSAKPAFNVPEVGETDGDEQNDSRDKSKDDNSKENGEVIPTDPYVPYVTLPSGYIGYPFLISPPPLGRPEGDSGVGTRTGQTPVDRRYFVSYYFPHIFHQSYAGYGFAPTIIYKPAHAYIK